jgi:hypothetical protein
MNTAKVVLAVAGMNLVAGSHADVVTLRFNMADLLDLHSMGGTMGAVDNPRRVFYKQSGAADGYNTWGATYSDSALERYNPNDPDYATAFANYNAWLATDPGVWAFDLSLRPYEGSQAWGQQLMLANPPADWSDGTDEDAAAYYTASTAPGWNSETYWSSWSGPTIGFYTADPASFLTAGMDDAWFELTGDFLMDTDYDGVADTTPQVGDSVRFWVGSVSDWITTSSNQWASLGITGLERDKDPQFNGVITAQVIPEPSAVLLLAMGSGVIFYGRRYRFF